MDVFDCEEEKSHALLLTTASSCQQLGNAETRSIYFTHVQKNKQTNKQNPPKQPPYCLYVKPVYKCLLFLKQTAEPPVLTLKRETVDDRRCSRSTSSYNLHKSKQGQKKIAYNYTVKSISSVSTAT